MGQVGHKVIFLGDVNVGKTSIIRQKCEKRFEIYVLPTAGSDTALIEVNVDGMAVELGVWDTAGQEEYQALVPLYLQRSAVAVLVCSILDPATVTRLHQFLAGRVRDQNQKAAVVAVVNKIDLVASERAQAAVQAELGREFENVFFVSAKTGVGIDGLFQEIARLASQAEEPLACVSIDAPRQPSRRC
jgi:small GTP-binding protein